MLPAASSPHTLICTIRPAVLWLYLLSLLHLAPFSASVVKWLLLTPHSLTSLKLSTAWRASFPSCIYSINTYLLSAYFYTSTLLIPTGYNSFHSIPQPFPCPLYPKDSAQPWCLLRNLIWQPTHHKVTPSLWLLHTLYLSFFVFHPLVHRWCPENLKLAGCWSWF